MTPDPTPGEVGLTFDEREAICICPWTGGSLVEGDAHETRCSQHRARILDLLAARTAALQAEMEVEAFKYEHEHKAAGIYRARAEVAEAEVAELRATEAVLRGEIRRSESAIAAVDDIVAQRDELRAKVERVEALAELWESTTQKPDYGWTPSRSATEKQRVAALRAALGGEHDGE